MLLWEHYFNFLSSDLCWCAVWRQTLWGLCPASCQVYDDGSCHKDHSKAVWLVRVCNITLSPLSKHVPFSILNTNQNMISKGPVWFFFIRFSTDLKLFCGTLVHGSHAAFQNRTWMSRLSEPCNIWHLPLKGFRHWCFPGTISTCDLGWPSALSALAQHDRCGFITWPCSAPSCRRTFIPQSMSLALWDRIKDVDYCNTY